MRVLIVESRLELRKLWVRHLERQGYAVTQACCQDDAVAHLSKEMADIIVPIYDKHFTESDIDGLIAFYRTPVGKKFIKELPLRCMNRK